ncbi:MAG: CPBP family intramembrane metalloprotease [Candidatus Bathyarchaeota archaeon]|nr:CPBP family intramembrane metalloprotease [Candidatus Bathyarchaeota archaeon]
MLFSDEKPLSKVLYVIGVAVIFIAVYVQYFVELGAVTGYLVVYGIPVAVVSVFFGKTLLSHAAKNNKIAFKYGIGLFGGFTMVGFVLSFVVLAILLQFDPNVTSLLDKPNPVLNVPSSQAWILMGISMLVVGPAEEYLFRGFMYGGLLSIFKGKHWLPLAVISGVMFAAVHGYYAITYEAASILPFITIITFGVAMAITFYWSGGNLLAAAVIHGLYDATGFLGVATNSSIGLAARFILITVGVAFAIFYVVMKKVRINPEQYKDAPAETQPPPVPPAIA